MLYAKYKELTKNWPGENYRQDDDSLSGMQSSSNQLSAACGGGGGGGAGEDLPRRFHCTEMNIGCRHDSSMQLEDGSKSKKLSSYKSNFKVKKSAIENLIWVAVTQNKFAKQNLNWIAPLRATKIVPAVKDTHAECLQEINAR